MVTKNKEVKDCCRMKSVDGYCPKPLEHLSEYLSKKWAMSIIITIGNFESLRFNDLLRRLDGITAKVLSYRLKELEKENIVQKIKFKTTELRVEYNLTKKGGNLMKALTPLISWAQEN